MNKVFREAEKEGKVDMVYKIYWDPKKLVKPIDDAQSHGKESRPQSRLKRVSINESSSYGGGVGASRDFSI